MSYDKVVDSSVLDAGLKQIADAIRAKTGVSDNLEFPNAMVEAINTIESGGSSDNSKLNALIDRSITEISSDVISIGLNAFSNCATLMTANFPVATSVENNAFANCTTLITANFPVATSIGHNTLSYCTSLTTVNLPAATSIGNSTFNGCTSLTTVNLPAAKSIGIGAFGNCHSLTALILRSETRCTLDRNAFTKCYHILGTVDTTYNPDGLKDGYIYVPSALVEAYQTSSNWSDYSTQFRALEDYTVDGTITGELDPNKI